MKFIVIRQEYIRKQTLEKNGDVESFHNSLKTDYISVYDIETLNDAVKLRECAFKGYNTVRPHSSNEYLPPEEFEKRWNEKPEFRNGFLEKKKKKIVYMNCCNFEKILYNPNLPPCSYTFYP